MYQAEVSGRRQRGGEIRDRLRRSVIALAGPVALCRVQLVSGCKLKPSQVDISDPILVALPGAIRRHTILVEFGGCSLHHAQNRDAGGKDRNRPLNRGRK